MANMSGILQPADVDGTTFTLANNAVSGNKVFYANAILRITVASAAGSQAGAVVTFGQTAQSQLGGTGHAPTTPSGTSGFFINANTPSEYFWLGPNRDTVNFFNGSGGAILVSIQPMMP